MPAYFPEANTAVSSDQPLRSLHKIASILFGLVGDQGPTYFPEGSEPQATDGEERLLQKINAMLGG